MDFVTDLPISRNADSMFVVVDRFSKAIVITPCLKAITAEETSQLYLDNVWRRTGLPRTVISDRGPQFASKVMKETWSKLNVDQALSTAFHPQTDGETERLKSLEQIRADVTAALNVAAEVMKRKGPGIPSQTFSPGQLVWLEGSNIKTTHPKAKLAPKRHGPFKILSTTPTNSRLQLPPAWRIHPMFHNSLLTPYKETKEHGPNFTQPPPDIVEGEEDHYEVETVLDARPTPNRRGIQYLIKWVGYPNSENSWIPASGMKHASKLVQEFHL